MILAFPPTTAGPEKRELPLLLVNVRRFVTFAKENRNWRVSPHMLSSRCCPRIHGCL